jgi:hypothetical protein
MTDYPVINGLIFAGLGVVVFIIAFWRLSISGSKSAKSAISPPPSSPEPLPSDSAGSLPLHFTDFL